MNKITDFENPDNSSFVSWRNKGEVIKKTTNGRLISLPTRGGNVLVLFISKDEGADNAVLYAPDGSMITRIHNPLKNEGAICFDDAYYVGNELTIIIGLRDRRVACVVDEEGEVKRLYETR